MSSIWIIGTYVSLTILARARCRNGCVCLRVVPLCLFWRCSRDGCHHHHYCSPEQVRAALRDFDTNLEIVSTEEQREEAIALATEQEDWLYDDGWDMDAATYRQKRAELAQVGGGDAVDWC